MGRRNALEAAVEEVFEAPEALAPHSAQIRWIAPGGVSVSSHPSIREFTGHDPAR